MHNLNNILSKKINTQLEVMKRWIHQQLKVQSKLKLDTNPAWKSQK